MDDEGFFGITKLKLQAFGLAPLGMSHLNDGEVEHPDYYMINIRVYLS